MSHVIKNNLKYTNDHEWAEIQNDTVTFGITDFAQASLGDIVFVELPGIGSTLEKGEPCGVIESIKSVNDIFSPVSGEVIEINQNVTDAPESLNQDAYNAWLVKVKINNPNQLNELMNAEEYTQHCEHNS